MDEQVDCLVTMEHKLEFMQAIDMAEPLTDDERTRKSHLRCIVLHQTLNTVHSSRPIVYSHVNFPFVARLWLESVGVDWVKAIENTQSFKVEKFLNRILGLEADKQNILFSVYLSLFEGIVKLEKQLGNYDEVPEIDDTTIWFVIHNTTI